jgi:hypothetical protein
MKLNANLVLVLVFCLVVATVFWPTLYRYEKSGSEVIRINRVTGLAQVLGDEGWNNLAPKTTVVGRGLFTVNPFDEAVLFLSDTDLLKIDGNAKLSGYGRFEGSLYNGTSFPLGKVDFEITAKRGDFVVWKRKYQQYFTSFEPMTSEKILIPVAGDEPGLFTEWRIVSAAKEPK